ncbi:MAG: flagellar hook-length control protein FliK [Oscillospiraceae bacterium]|nr:flagellar hook-length control protein FliK [Oscillospiraceae bacterium]
MTNTVLFNLQAASMAAAVNSGQKFSNAEDISGGMKFSDILASQTSQTVQTDALTKAAEGTEIPAENIEDIIDEETGGGMFSEAMKLIEKSDDAVKKTLSLLLKTVLNAMRGSSDGEERKTDMFMILADGSAGFSDEDDLLNSDLLLSAEIMNRLGLMLETAAVEKDTDSDVLFGDLEKVISQILGVKDDDSEVDELAAADALAAMLNVAPDEIESLSAVDSETKAEAIGNAAEVLKAPMDAVKQEVPEKVSEAEKLYSELAAEVVSKTEEAPETAARAGFSALKINNASDQISNIGRKISSEAAEEVTEQTVMTENTFAEVNADTESKSGNSDSKPDAEVAAAGIQAETVFVRGEIGTEEAPTELDAKTAISVEDQVRDVVTDEISEFGDENGVKELVLILRPRELGQIAVKLVKEANTVSVIMSAQYEEVGKLMNQRAAYLGESLSDKNYDVKDVRIVEPGNAAEQMGLNLTDQGFSFARNSGNPNGSESGRSYRGENDGYGEIDGIEEINADRGDVRFREAKLWATA